ncbi:MAG: TetR/AcrR family transcriptional regulator, partial [Casimicrobiaceae bacterium]
GQMAATEREIGAVATNVVLVSTYWMSWQRVTGAASGTPGDHRDVSLDHAAHQVLALIAPFLLGDGRALIERLGDDYL